MLSVPPPSSSTGQSSVAGQTTLSSGASSPQGVVPASGGLPYWSTQTCFQETASLPL